MNKLSNRNPEGPGFNNIRYGLQRVAKAGAISLLAVSGTILGLEGLNA